jgi:hypothetical protein
MTHTLLNIACEWKQMIFEKLTPLHSCDEQLDACQSQSIASRRIVPHPGKGDTLVIITN